MSSSLNEGDIVLALSKKIVPLRIGDDIVFKDDSNELLIKKIIRKKEKGYSVSGTSRNSLDRDSVGLIPREKILGKVIYTFSTAQSYGCLY